MNFNFIQTDKKLPEFPGFYKSIGYELIILAFGSRRGVVVESDQYEIGFYRRDCHNFEDATRWTRISGKIEL